MHVEVGRDDDLVSIPCRRAPDCNAVSEGLNVDEIVEIEDFVDPYIIVYLLETVDGIMRELCRLSLSTCLKEMEGNQIGRTNLGGEAGELKPTNWDEI